MYKNVFSLLDDIYTSNRITIIILLGDFNLLSLSWSQPPFLVNSTSPIDSYL